MKGNDYRDIAVVKNKGLLHSYHTQNYIAPYHLLLFTNTIRQTYRDAVM